MYANMNKGQLRQSMRDAGLSYKGMSVDDMRNALAAHTPAPVAPQVDDEAADLAAGAALADAALHQYPEHTVAGEFEHPSAAEEEAAPEVQEQPVPEVQESAPTTQEAAPTTPARNTSKGLKIEKEREQRNGVKRPSAGGLCRAVWDYLDGVVASGAVPDAKGVKADAPTVGWNPNNASIEFYQWRKFNGISGRTPKPAAAPTPTEPAAG